MAIPFVLLQIVAVPSLTSLVVFAIGGRLGKRVGWIAFASLLYTSFLLLYIGIGLYDGGSPLTETYDSAPRRRSSTPSTTSTSCSSQRGSSGSRSPRT